MYCQNCGNQLMNNADVCVKCGCSVVKNVSNTNTPIIPNEYKPISMWGYFGYEILFAIPVIGFIFLIIFSLGGTSNKNVRNFARSYFCIAIIFIILFLIIVAMGGAYSVGAMY